jgi:hypothetical protein
LTGLSISELQERQRISGIIANEPERFDDWGPSAVGQLSTEPRRWNTRSAVDLATIETQLTTVMGATAAGPHLKNLNRAVRALDRLRSGRTPSLSN